MLGSDDHECPERHQDEPGDDQCFSPHPLQTRASQPTANKHTRKVTAGKHTKRCTPHLGGSPEGHKRRQTGLQRIETHEEQGEAQRLDQRLGGVPAAPVCGGRQGQTS